METSDKRIKRIEPKKPPAQERTKRLSLEQKTVSFLSGFFRQCQKSCAEMGDAAGATMPAMALKLHSYSEAFEIAATAVDWVRDPLIFSSDEMAGDMATPIVEMINTMMRSTSRAFYAGQDGRRYAGRDAGQDGRQSNGREME